MNASLLLLGVGGAGAGVCRAVNRAFGENVRTIVADTDASSGEGFADGQFVLVGGKRLAGRGSGRQIGTAQIAFQDDPTVLDGLLDGVRVAIVAAALAGGTGGGVTGEILKRLRQRGIATILFAALPFAFEGEDAARNARTAAGALAHYANASILLPLDVLVGETGEDVMAEAFARAVDAVATGITLFWRILQKPGYLHFDVERLRAMLQDAGPSRFAVASAMGEGRAQTVLETLRTSPLLVRDNAPALRRILLGVLAGDDLRLSEIGTLSEGLRTTFGGAETHFDLGTVNDEATFSGRLVAVAFLCEETTRNAAAEPVETARPRMRRNGAKPDARALGLAGRFSGADRSLWGEEDLDVPTYLRRNLTLER